VERNRRIITLLVQFFRHAPTLEILATNYLDDTIDATPVLVGREIIIRGEKQLYCIAEQ